MNEEWREYLVQVPEESIGEVAGDLTVRGAQFTSMETNDGVVNVEFRALEEMLEGFPRWLSEVTNGKGKLSKNA